MNRKISRQAEGVRSLAPSERLDAPSRREKASDPLFVLTKQLPELARDTDDERPSPYPD